MKTKRVIKFRAWINNGYMAIWENTFFSDMSPVTNYGSEFPNKDDSLVILMQYTGLKDKNGKEIYEGDILKHHGIVAWNNLEYRWSAIDLNWNDRREWHDLDYLTSPFEIIGNIYENKELLKS